MKISKKQYKKIRREAIIDVLLYIGFQLIGLGVIVCWVMF